MRKLLCSAAVVGLAIAATPAMAQGDDSLLSLGLGGHFKGYVTWHDQDEAVGEEARTFDILRETEIHFTGETTLDNGLTVGAHVEAETDMGDGFAVDESYVYFAGGWGRINFGGEDGAAYLLQVAAPSADSNIDGIRQFIDPVNYAEAPAAFAGLGAFQWDYAADFSGSHDKITYITPVFNGFQAAASYTPDVDDFSAPASRSLAGVNEDDAAGEFGDAWEGALRYEGQFDSFGLTLGAGYTHVDLEEDAAGEDDFEGWNAGAAITVANFGLGAVYREDNNGEEDDADTEVWVVGADYVTGPYKLGASYMNRDDEDFVGTDELETDRYSGGVSYTFAPGMTYVGSVHFIDHEVDDDDMDATSLLLGAVINF